VPTRRQTFCGAAADLRGFIFANYGQGWIMMKRTLGAFGCAALLALGASAAHADVVTFDDVLPGIVFPGDTVTSGGFHLTQLGADAGLVAQNADFSIFGNAPKGNLTQYYGVFNDGSVQLSHAARSFLFKGLDYGFVSPIGGIYNPGDEPGGLLLEGLGVDGKTYGAFASFGGADGDGEFSFISTTGLGALGGQYLTSLTFTACSFDGANGCVTPFFNLNQFAIDNLVLDLPEPGSLTLAVLALCGAGFARRRQTR
jgi:hypothetical protein